VPDVWVNLQDSYGNYVASTQADATGYYQFTGSRQPDGTVTGPLYEGQSYRISITLPDGYTDFTQPLAGSPDLDSDMAYDGSVIGADPIRPVMASDYVTVSATQPVNNTIDAGVINGAVLIAEPINAENPPAQAPAIKYNRLTLGDYFKEFNALPAGAAKQQIIDRNKDLLGIDYTSAAVQTKYKNNNAFYFVAPRKLNGLAVVAGGFITYVKFSVDNFNTIPAADQGKGYILQTVTITDEFFDANGVSIVKKTAYGVEGF
jgi:YD repeat-containing protein